MTALADPDVIDLGPIRLERDGTAIQVLNRHGEEVVAYIEHAVEGDEEWAALRQRVMRDDVPFRFTPRGFKCFKPISTTYGHRVEVYESSAADVPHVWLAIELTAEHAREAHSNIEPEEARAHMTLDDAAALRDQLDSAIRRHYHGDDPAA
jgi:hypothetical protein